MSAESITGPFFRFAGLVMFLQGLGGLFYGIMIEYGAIMIFLKGLKVGNFTALFFIISMLGLAIIYLGYLYVKYGIKLMKNGGLNAFEVYGRVAYINATLVFILGSVIFFSAATFISAMSSVHGDGSTGVEFLLLLIPLIIALFYIVVGTLLIKETIVGAYLNLGLNTVTMALYMTIFFGLGTIDAMFLSNIVHFSAAICLVVKSHAEAYYSSDDDDEFDFYGSAHAFEYKEEPILSRMPPRNAHPKADLQGEWGDDGYEWLEHPYGSEKWYWRDENGQWVSY